MRPVSFEKPLPRHRGPLRARPTDATGGTVTPDRCSVQTGVGLAILRVSTSVGATTAAAAERAWLLMASAACGCRDDAVIVTKLGRRALLFNVNFAK